MIDTPQIAQLSEKHIAVIHVTVPRNQIQTVMGPGIQELMATVQAQGLGPTGPWFTHHLRMAPDVFDFEIGVPVTAPVKESGRVKPSVWPAMKVARTVHSGQYEKLDSSWRAFMSWIEEHGLKPAEDLWEVYAAGPESSSDPAQWRTELNRPLVG
jgi:effector-binding domain-containing protein